MRRDIAERIIFNDQRDRQGGRDNKEKNPQKTNKNVRRRTEKKGNDKKREQ